MTEWKSPNEAFQSPSVWGAVLQLIGAILIAWGSNLNASTAVRIQGLPAAMVSIDSPVTFYTGWISLALGLALQALTALKQ